jgi:hypothetical protein
MNEAMLLKKYRDCEQERKALIAIRRKLEEENETLKAKIAEHGQAGDEGGEKEVIPEPQAPIAVVAENPLNDRIDVACRSFAENHERLDCELLVVTVQVAARWLLKWRMNYINPGANSINVQTDGFITQAAGQLMISSDELKSLVFGVLISP